ncbi:YeeE/YedE family protein [Thalassobaculum sp.]|uniref:YeeE/YedE family protein n=1 Tax=Thalassobaculum sp. TaxID=2022740 RepID=UPI0032ECBE5E
MEQLLASDALSDSGKIMLGGAVVGLIFGYCAQQSRFCLRSACIEFWGGQLGPKLAVWLAVFGTALLATQALLANGGLNPQDVRQLATVGSLSGAIVGGLLFGVGMILARGCASRLLVLSATGNARALIAGLVVTVAAQASLSGVLSPLREALNRLWVVGPSTRDMAQHLPDGTGLALGVGCVALAGALAWRNRVAVRTTATAAGVGLAVGLGWAFTAALSRVSFEPVTVGSVTFTGPSADTLMALIVRPDVVPSFGIGLVPGVFAGSLAATLVHREFRLQGFDAGTGTVRYLVGAVLMGFGGMAAGGCAVGAGVTGGSVLSLTAWVALLSMWIGAGAAGLLLERAEAIGRRETAQL